MHFFKAKLTLILILLTSSLYAQPALQGFRMGFGFVTGFSDALEPGEGLEEASDVASSHHKVCKCGTVYLMNLSTYDGPQSGTSEPIGDILVNGVYYVTGSGTGIQADQWAFGEVIAVNLSCDVYGSGTWLNFLVYHTSDNSQPNEYDQIFNPCSNCRQDKGYLETQSLPNVDAGEDLIKCEEETIQLNATGATNYEWSPSQYLSNPEIPNPSANNPISMEYIVEGSETFTYSNYVPVPYSRTCKATDAVNIEVDPGPILTLESTVYICDPSMLPYTFHAGGVGDVSYQWFWQSTDQTQHMTLGTSEQQSTYFGGSGSLSNNDPFGMFTVSATSINGCENRAGVELMEVEGVFGYGTAYDPTDNTVDFSMMDVAPAGTTHAWGIAYANTGTVACDKLGSYINYSYSVNPSYSFSNIPFGSGAFYLYHSESFPGCSSPVIKEICIQLGQRPDGMKNATSSNNSGSKSEITSFNSQQIGENIMVNRIYPNPTKSEITIDFNQKFQPNRAGMSGNIKLILTSILGKTVLEKNENTSVPSTNLDVSGVEPGFYLLKIVCRDQIQTEKIEIIN